MLPVPNVISLMPARVSLHCSIAILCLNKEARELNNYTSTQSFLLFFCPRGNTTSSTNKKKLKQNGSSIASDINNSNCNNLNKLDHSKTQQMLSQKPLRRKLAYTQYWQGKKRETH